MIFASSKQKWSANQKLARHIESPTLIAVTIISTTTCLKLWTTESETVTTVATTTSFPPGGTKDRLTSWRKKWRARQGIFQNGNAVHWLTSPCKNQLLKRPRQKVEGRVARGYVQAEISIKPSTETFFGLGNFILDKIHGLTRVHNKKYFPLIYYLL